jgi:hypothetical protein
MRQYLFFVVGDIHLNKFQFFDVLVYFSHMTILKNRLLLFFQQQQINGMQAVKGKINPKT